MVSCVGDDASAPPLGSLLGAEGLLARCHRLDRTLRSNDKCRAVREPEWKGLRSKLAKAFPTLPDLSKDAKLESFRARATETAAELRHGYELFVDLEAHLAVHLTTLRAMLGQLRHYSLDEGRETTRSVLRLFNAYTRLLKFASTIPDRKALVALYACALKAASRPLPGNYEPVAKKLLPRLDDCWRFCVEAFKEHVATLSTLVAQQLELVQLHSEGAPTTGKQHFRPEFATWKDLKSPAKPWQGAFFEKKTTRTH